MLRLLATTLFAGFAVAEDGLAAWLRYAPYPGSQQHAASVPQHVVALNQSIGSPVYVAGQELQQGIQGIFGKSCEVHHGEWGQGAWGHGGWGQQRSSIVVGTLDEYNKVYGDLPSQPDLIEDGYWLSNEGNTVQILGANERGALYGAFQYLSMLAQGNFTQVAFVNNPESPIRWTNEWDNLDGSIERGFAGNSIWFANGTIVTDLDRAVEYARLLASIGINAVVVNNVNANATLLSPQNLDGLGRLADVWRPYGVQLGISLYFAAPASAVPGQANLTTYDPLDEGVIAWWTNVTNQLYQRVPDMAGYLVKANSEGQPGPETYNRTLAQGANLFAKALKPYGGVVMFRAFVYNPLNESDWTADRANAAVDFFKPLDGEFDDNVAIQIKYGPIDFQVREPPSPLFANLPNTAVAIELQITQEYQGQQCHLFYWPTLWQYIYDFDLRVNNQTSLVRDITTGKTFNKKLSGAAGVSNVGNNDTWLGSQLSMSNLYAFGRMAWNPADDPTAILQDWIRLTWSHDQSVIDTITQMSIESWPAYENYTGNLGTQTLTDILYTHFGPNPQSQDNNKWGQWTRADKHGIGMDRTVSNGTGNAGQYPPQVMEMFEYIDTTPDNLMLWFHHVNYTQLLHNGLTVIQDFYDKHYAGAQTAQNFYTQWASLKGKIDDWRWNDQVYRQAFQAGHSLVWRDAIVNWMHNNSGVADKAGRVGHHPYRIEAESMELDGYKIYNVLPFELASNWTAIVTNDNTTTGTASTTVTCESGTYNVAVNYYDQYGGDSHFVLSLNGQTIGEWDGNFKPWIGNSQAPRVLGHTPSIYLDGHSAIRITFENVQVNKGDVLKIVGTPNGIEPAPLDYISILPLGVVD